MNNVRQLKATATTNRWATVPWCKVTDKSDKCTGINVTLDTNLLTELSVVADAAVRYQKKANDTFPNLRYVSANNFSKRIQSWLHTLLSHNTHMVIDRRQKSASRWHKAMPWIAVAVAAAAAVQVARLLAPYVRV